MGLVARMSALSEAVQSGSHRSRLPAGRLRRLWTFFRLRAKMRLGAGGSCRERVLGMMMSAENLGLLSYLFYEVFVREEYAFESASGAPLIFDVGGNIGMATLYFKTRFPDATVEVFEPSPAAFALLKRNIEQNALAGVTPHHAAAASHDGTITLFSSAEEQSSLMASTRSERGGSARAEVPAIRLSARIDRQIDFLKLDIEGAEVEVLEELAAADKLRFIRQMAIEYHHHLSPDEDRFSRCLALLEEHGFGYQIRAHQLDLYSPRRFQDMLVFAYRKQ